MIIKKLFIIILFMSFFSCSRLEGEFAYKFVLMDTYKKFNDGMEFSFDKKVDWIFKTKNLSSVYRVGIIISKKEAVWVEVLKYYKNLDVINPHVYGTIENLEPGKYKISIVEVKEEELVAEKFFSIYKEIEE